MAGTRITDFPLLPSGELAAEDVFLTVDVSDTFYSPSGTNKQTTLYDILRSPLAISANSFGALSDTPEGWGSVGQIVKVSPAGNSLVFSDLSSVSGSVGAFTDLSDTVSSLGSQGQLVVVDNGQLGFSGLSTIPSAFSDLTDTPGSLGTAGQSVIVAADGNSLIFSGAGTSDITAFTGLSDTVSYLGNEGQVPVMSGGILAFSGITLTSTTQTVMSGTLTEFTGLSDTPSSYHLPGGAPGDTVAGSGIIVNSAGDGLEFLDTGKFFVGHHQTGAFGGGGSTTFSGLTDTPSSFGVPGQSVVVDAAGTSLVFSGVTGGAGGSSTFVNLTDTPVGLGSAGQSVVVNAAGTSLVFSGVEGGGGSGEVVVFNQIYTGDGVVSNYLLSSSVTDEKDLLVSIQGFVQTPTIDYTITGSTGISFSTPVSSGDEISFRHLFGKIGPSGIVGASGADGVQGPSGAQGIQGPSGLQGSVGSTGASGLIGPTGQQGPQGADGIQGPAGAGGADGIDGTGIQGTLASDRFTGDGVVTGFNLSNTIAEEKNILVSINGLIQSPLTNYVIDGSGLNFPQPPGSGLEVEVRHLAGLQGPSGAVAITGVGVAFHKLYTGDGVTTNYILPLEVPTSKDLLVSVQGFVQTPTIDYNFIGTTGVLFATEVASGDEISFRHLSVSNSTTDVDFSSVSEDILPATTNTYDLGSSGKRWKDLWLSGTSIYLGQQVLKESGAALSLSTDNGASFSDVLTETSASETYVTVSQSAEAASYNFDTTADFNNTSAAFSNGMLEPAENGRLELDLATGMFTEDFNSLSNIDSSNSSSYSIDNGSFSINKQLITGNGNDGNVTVSGAYTIDQDSLISGRSAADAITYTLTNLSSTTATCSATVSGIAVGDEVMVYCAQGYNGATTANWGNYEFFRVDSVSGNDIVFTSAKQKYYGSASNGDANIGTGSSAMKVIVQRVPNYNNLTIQNGVTMTCKTYESTGGTGGKMVFRVNGQLKVYGLLSVSYKGYAGGTSGPNQGGSFRAPFDNGTWNSARNYSGGGGRDSDTGGNTPGGGANYADGTAGSCQGGLSYVNLGLITSNTDDSKIFMGGGGGELNADGGSGGGLAYIHAADLTTYSTADFEAKGTNGAVGGYSNNYGSRGGGGGSFYITVNTTTLNSTNIDIRAGSSPNFGYNAGIGRFLFKYVTLSAGSLLSGSGIDNIDLAGFYNATATIQSINVLSPVGQVDSIQSLITTMNTLPGSSSATVQFAQGTGTGYYWQDSTGGSGLSTTIPVGTSQTTSLSSLDWSGSNFYYKISLSGNGSATPILDQLKVDYSPDMYIGTEQSWTSQGLGDGTKKITPTSFTAYWTKDPEINDVKPKFQLWGSDTEDFASVNYYPGPSSYYQNAGTYSIDNAISFNLTTAITQYNKYWKIITLLSSGPTIRDAPTVDRMVMKANIANLFDDKGIAKAWVNFVGATGSNASITDSLNIASVSRITTGVYNVNFSGDFNDTNYMFSAGGYQNEGQWPVIPVRDSTGIVSVSGYQIAISSGLSRVDPLGESVHLSFLGG